MRKNVLVSILAMTSASTMTAYANADIDQIRHDDTTPWEGADDLTVESGVITSPNGTTITQTINLVNGKYKFTFTADNAEIKVNGKSLAADGTFTLDSEGEAKVEIIAKEAGKKFTVSDMKLQLVYTDEIKAAIASWTETKDQITKSIIDGLGSSEDFLLRASEISAELAKLNDETKAYEAYKSNELHKGLETCKIATMLNKLQADIEASVGVDALYNTTMKLYAEYQAKFDAIATSVGQIADADTKEYVEKQTSGLKAAAETLLGKAAEIKEAYNNGSGDIEATKELCSEENNNTFKTEIEAALSEYSEKADAAKLDWPAYKEIAEKITILKTAVTTASKEVFEAATDADYDVKTLFDNMRTAATAELQTVSRKIADVEKANGTDDDCSNAYESYDSNTTALEEAAAELESVKSKYITLAENAKAEYYAQKALLDEVKGKLTDLKNTPAVAANFGEDITATEGLISTLEKKIREAYEAYMVAGENDYTTDFEKINSSISAIEEKAEPYIASYEAYKVVTGYLTDLNTKLEEAKTKVNGLVSADKSYAAKDRYTDTEKKIADAITALQGEADAADKNFVCHTWLTENQERIDQAGTDITNYIAGAENALADYEAVTTAVKEYTDAVGKLKETVGTNTAVPVGNTGKTYGNNITDFQNKIAEITTAKDDALGQKDAAHVKALAAAKALVDSYSNIPADAETLSNSFQADKDKYDSDAIEIALQKILKQANDLINASESKLQEPVEASTGKAYEELLEEYTAIKTDIETQKKAVEDASIMSDKNAAMAVLTTINSELAEIDKKIVALNGKIEDATKHVTANNNKRTEAEGLFTTIEGVINSITTEDQNDPYKDFTEDVNSLNAQLATIKAEVTKAYADEALADGWDDTTDAESNVIKGFGSRINELKAAADALLEKAESATESYNTYTGFIAEWDKVKAELDKVTAGLDAAGIGPDARPYYDGVKKEEETNLDLIKTAAEEWCKDGTIVEETVLNELKSRLAESSNAIKAIVTNAIANEESHNSQTTKYSETSKKLDETYSTILNGDQSSAAAVYLNQLTELRNQLDKINKEIAEAYKNGNSKGSGIEAKLETIYTAVTNIEKKQEDGYDEQILADNTKRHNDFLAAYNNAIDKFDDAIKKINRYSSEITDQELMGTTTAAVTTAHTTVNEILVNLYNLKSDELTEFNSTSGKELFDPDKTFEADANKYKDEIIAAVTALDKTVSDKARALYGTKLNDAETALNTAIATLEARNYDSEVVSAAFPDVKEIVKNAKNQYDEDVADFALAVNGWLLDLGKVEGTLTAEQDNAAEAQYEKVYQAASEKKDKELKDLEGFRYTNDENLERRDYYLNGYKALVTSYFDEATALKESTKHEDMYETLSQMQLLFEQFTTEATTLYNNAKSEMGSQEANQAAYDSMKDMLDKLQAKLDAAAEYAEAFVFTDDCGQNTCQTLIDNWRTNIEEYYTDGSCVFFELELKQQYANYETLIASIYSRANNTEEVNIRAQIEELKIEQNQATTAVRGDEAKEKEVAAYADVIAEIAEDFAAMLGSADFNALDPKEKQPYYIEYEKRIADTRAELAAYYDAALGGNTYQALTDRIEEIKNDYAAVAEKLNGCHDKVKEEFSDKLAAVGTAADGIKAEADKYNAEGDILFYNDKLSAGIDKLAAELEALSEAIDSKQAPYTANTLAYGRLTAELQTLQEALDATVAKISEYKFYDVTAENQQNWIKSIQSDIDLSKSMMESANENWELTEESQLYNKATIESNIAVLYKNATYLDLHKNISGNDAGKGALVGLYAEVESMITANLEDKEYTDEARADIISRANAIVNAINALYQYNNAAFDGYVVNDIDGNQIKNEDGTVIGKSINYIDEAVPEIAARIIKITEDIASLKTDASENAFIRGDVDRDGYVLVNDYMDILDFALGKEEVEKGSLKFLAADANKDGNINVGDLTQVTNIILHGNSSQRTGVNGPLQAPAGNAAADAVEMTAADNGNVKVIAVNLKSVRTYVGYQLDVKLPVGVTLLNEKTGNRVADHALYSNTLSDGTHRIIVSSMENNAFSADGDALLYLEVSGKLANRVTVSNVMAADADGVLYTIDGTGNDGTTGIDGVNAEMSLKEKIYSVGGQMMKSMKKGINIIRNSDGSTKKVMGE